jgi:hypothetical protein
MAGRHVAISAGETVILPVIPYLRSKVAVLVSFHPCEASLHHPVFLYPTDSPQCSPPFLCWSLRCVVENRPLRRRSRPRLRRNGRQRVAFSESGPAEPMATGSRVVSSGFVRAPQVSRPPLALGAVPESELTVGMDRAASQGTFPGNRRPQSSRQLTTAVDERRPFPCHPARIPRGVVRIRRVSNAILRPLARRSSPSAARSRSRSTRSRTLSRRLRLPRRF